MSSFYILHSTYVEVTGNEKCVDKPQNPKLYGKCDEIGFFWLYLAGKLENLGQTWFCVVGFEHGNASVT